MKLTFKYFTILLASLSLRASLAFGQALSGEVLRLRGTTLPVTCNTGDVRFQTSTSKLKVCIANLWSEIAMSTASFTANRVLATDNAGNVISSQLAIDSSGVIEPLTDISTDFGSTNKRFSALFAIEVDSGTSDFRITSPRILTSLTANRALVSDATSAIGVSPVTTSELTFVSGVTSQLCGINQTCTFTNKSIDADNNVLTDIDNDEIKAAAGIVYSKLTLTNSVVNADVASNAAIAYSKLNLTNSILGADFSTASGITVATIRSNSDSSFGGNVTASGNFIGNLVGNVTGALTGTASVAAIAGAATAFTTTPTPCGANQYALAIAANGNLTCAQVSFSQLSGTASIAQGGTNNGTLSVTAGKILYTDGSKIMASDVGTANQVLISNGSSAPTWADNTAGRLLQQIFTASGTYTIPTGVTTASMLKATVVGGGGGGGGGNASHAGGGGGGAAACAVKYIGSLVPGGTLTVTIGGGGPGGGAASNGTVGTASTLSTGSFTISTVTSSPGVFGIGSTGAGPARGGDGGTASGTDFVTTGQSGSGGYGVSGAGGGGLGGASCLSGGGRGGDQLGGSVHGFDGRAGGGGGGGGAVAGTTNGTGGAGGGGIIILELIK